MALLIIQKGVYTLGYGVTATFNTLDNIDVQTVDQAILNVELMAGLGVFQVSLTLAATPSTTTFAVNDYFIAGGSSHLKNVLKMPD